MQGLSGSNFKMKLLHKIFPSPSLHSIALIDIDKSTVGRVPKSWESSKVKIHNIVSR